MRPTESVAAKPKLPQHDVADLSLAPAGEARIEWAAEQMPVLARIAERFAAEQPLAGATIGLCLHVTAETAILVRALAGGGADVALCAANPLSTQDDVAAALVAGDRLEVFARHGEDLDTFAAHVGALVAREPDITLDDGADLLTRAARGAAGGRRADARRDRGDDDRARAAARHGGRGPARLPGDRRQRGAHRARLQRPLRHRPVDARRHPARDERPARRRRRRGRRLRLDRQGDRAARPGARRQRHRLRGRPDPRAGGAHGGLRGDDGARGRRARRRLHHRHRQQRRADRRALRAHEGRRDPRQRRALRRGDRPRRRSTASRAPTARCARSSRSTSSTGAG